MSFTMSKKSMITISLLFILTIVNLVLNILIYYKSDQNHVKDADRDSDEVLVVNTKYGKIKGKMLFTMYKQLPYYSFKGIPYARAPILDRRFKPAEPPISWNDTLEAFDFRKNCISVLLHGSEDCLFINIDTTDILQPSKSLPVLVIIHGGVFKAGSARFSGPDFLINEDPNLVVVSFNYRLGPLGFLSLGTPEHPGNLGLKDQVMALKWVNENIHSFGGDKNKITLYGLSSGSAAAHLHVLSTESEGLFQRAILASGTGLNQWAVRSNDHLPELFKFAEKNGVKPSNVTELIEYLKSVDNIVLFDHNSNLIEDITNIKDIELHYTPIIESPGSPQPFLSRTPRDILSDGYSSDVDIMFGVSSNEASFMVSQDIQNPKNMEHFNKFFEVVLPLHSANVNLDFNSKEYKKASQKIRQFYFNGSGGNVTNNTLSDYVKMVSDIRFNYGIDLSVRLHANYTSGRIYFYKFSGDTCLNYKKHNQSVWGLDFSGATHADDSFYVFRRYQNDRLYLDVKNGTVEHSLISNICKMYMNFIKYGNPTPGNEPVYFEPVRPDKLNYLELTNAGILSGQVEPFGENMHFWDNLLKEFNLFY